MWASIHTCTHMHTHAYTCTHMHTHAHTYTHVQAAHTNCFSNGTNYGVPEGVCKRNIWHNIEQSNKIVSVCLEHFHFLTLVSYVGCK